MVYTECKLIVGLDGEWIVFEKREKMISANLLIYFVSDQGSGERLSVRNRLRI